MPALILFLLFVLATLLYLAPAAMVMEGLGNRIVELRLFYGKKVLSTFFRGREFSLGILPLGGFVQPERAPFIAWDYGRSSLPGLAALATMGISGATLLGPARAWTELIAGVQQFLQGAWSPLDSGKHLWASIFEFMRTAPLPLAFGMVAIKIAAVNLMPVSTTPLGAMAFHGLSGLLGLSTRTMEYIALVGALAMFLAAGCWGVALVAYAVSGSPGA